jgi:hypothetical protein
MMNKSIFVSILMIAAMLVGSRSFAQQQTVTDNVWKTLGKLSFKKEYDEVMGFKIDKPVFSEAVKALGGKQVTLKGYIIPTDGYKSHKEFIFSAFPYSSCFFCGGAGPETVMEVESVSGIKFTADQVTIRGTLVLNDKDINRLMYKLTGAVLVK